MVTISRAVVKVIFGGGWDRLSGFAGSLTAEAGSGEGPQEEAAPPSEGTSGEFLPLWP